MLALAFIAFVFLLPEWCLRMVVMNLKPGSHCTVEDVKVHLAGFDLRNFRMADSSFTADVAAATVRRRGGQWHVQVASGTLAFAAVASSPSTSAVPRVAGTSTWTTLPSIAPAAALHVTISNLAVSVPASTPMPALDALCHIDAVSDERLATQLWVATTIFLPGQSTSELHIVAWQAGADTGIELPSATFDAARLLKSTVPELTVKTCPVRLTASGVASPLWGTASLVRAGCELGASASTISIKPSKLTIKNPRLSGGARLKRAWTLPYVAKDPVGYCLARFDAAVTARVDELRISDVRFSNIVAVVAAVSNRIELVDAQATLCGGTVNAAGTFERRKVKGKDYHRFLYSVALGVTNINAEQICRTLKMSTNKVEGAYNGTIAASGFGKRVISFSGGLQSSGAGVLHFPEAEKYIGGMQESYNKDVLKLKAQEYNNYVYRSSQISLQFAPQTTSTVVAFDFVSPIDNVKFHLEYDSTWMDAIQLMMSLK